MVSSEQRIVVDDVRPRRRGRASFDRSSPLVLEDVCRSRTSAGRLRWRRRRARERVDRHPVELVDRALPAERPQVDAFAQVGQERQMLGPVTVERVQHDQPAVFSASPRRARRPALGAWVTARPAPCAESAVQHLVAPLHDDLPLLRDQLVVAPGVGVDVEQPALGDPLRVVQQGARPCRWRSGRRRRSAAGSLFGFEVGDAPLVLPAGRRTPTSPGRPAVRRVRAAGCPAAAVVPAGADDVQAAQFGDLVLVGLVASRRAGCRCRARPSASTR